jgi:hypothetical protein
MQRAFEDSSLTMDDLRQHWHEAWQRHDADLRSYFAGRNNFFAFDITVPQEQAALCRFLRRRGYRIRGNALPHSGARPSPIAHRKSMSEVLATIADRRYLGPPALAS